MTCSKFVRSLVPVVAIGFLALSVASTPANATALTTTFTVKATVQATCLISAGDLAFGTYTGAIATNTSNISVTCTSTTPYNVGLNAGLSGGTVATRKMKNGANTLSYFLYSDAATTNWNDTGAGNPGGAGIGTAQTLKVYGSVPAAQYVVPGDYTDTITATVTY